MFLFSQNFEQIVTTNSYRQRVPSSSPLHPLLEEGDPQYVKNWLSLTNAVLILSGLRFKLFSRVFFPPEFPYEVIRTAKLIVTTVLYLKEQIYHGLRLFYCKYTCCHFRQDSIIDDLNIKFSPGYYYRRGCNILTINTFKQKMNITLKKKTNAFSLYHWKLWKSE